MDRNGVLLFNIAFIPVVLFLTYKSFALFFFFSFFFLSFFLFFLLSFSLLLLLFRLLYHCPLLIFFLSNYLSALPISRRSILSMTAGLFPLPLAPSGSRNAAFNPTG